MYSRANRLLAALGAALACCVLAKAQSGEPFSLSVSQSTPQAAPGCIFITPSPIGTLPAGSNTSSGPEIVDAQGRPVWFRPLPTGWIAADLRVQTYQGQPVLTWAEGPGFQYLVPGSNTDYICDTHYNVIATVQAGNGLNADEHEFQLTAEGTALITAYRNVPADLSSVGGSPNGTVQEGVAQEIDVATGKVLLEWHSLDHVPVAESHAALPANPNDPYDYFHINSVKVDVDGNLLISSRHTWTVYKVDRTSGAVIWRLGGKSSDFALGAGLPFAWQHDVEAVDATTLRLFDNGSNGVPQTPYSRVLWVHHDDVAHTASVIRSLAQPQGLSAAAEGDAQPLANGDTFVGWGLLGRFSEFDSSGNLVFDAALPSLINCYRGYRFAWSGVPSSPPSASAHLNADGSTTVDAVWNGASTVATWNVLGGDSAQSQAVLASGPWNGLDTAITFASSPKFLSVEAVDSQGNVLSTSAAVSLAPVIAQSPASQTVATGSTVVFRVTATGGPLSYQWYHDGTALADATTGAETVTGSQGPVLMIEGVGAADAGNYACTVSNAADHASSAPAVLALADPSGAGRLVNVSARANVAGPDNPLIAGFAVSGQANAADSLLIRASGPALADLGIAGTLADPTIAVVQNGSAAPLLEGDFGWNSDAQIASTAAAVGAFPWSASSSLDQATVQQLPAGPYTVVVNGASGDSGISLVEVYDATSTGDYSLGGPYLSNVSARASVGSAGNVLIAGFVIAGNTSRTVLVRASGPSLAGFGISGFLADPQITVYAADGSGTVLASNTGWNASAVVARAASRVGAFAWPASGSQDSGFVVTLPPGAYTAVVSGASGDAGVALVEVYDVP